VCGKSENFCSKKSSSMKQLCKQEEENQSNAKSAEMKFLNKKKKGKM